MDGPLQDLTIILSKAIAGELKREQDGHEVRRRHTLRSGMGIVDVTITSNQVRIKKGLSSLLLRKTVLIH